MIRKLSDQLRFEYEIYLVPDGIYGILVRENYAIKKMAKIWWFISESNLIYTIIL